MTLQNLAIDPNTFSDLKTVIDEFNPTSITNQAALKRINETAAKLIMHSNNIEYAINTLDQLGLRKKLLSMNLKGDGTNDASYWLNKEPLRSFGPNELPQYTSGKLKDYQLRATGKTAKDLGIKTVAHETKSMLAYESIIRSHSGEPNVLISRNNFPDEAAAYGDGFYTKIGRQGAVGSGLTIRFNVNPNAREGIDFIKTNDYIIVLNKKSIKVIPEVLNFSLTQLVDLVESGNLKIDESDKGRLELFKRRLNADRIVNDLE